MTFAPSSTAPWAQGVVAMFELIDICPICKRPLNDGTELKTFGDPDCPFTGHAACVAAEHSAQGATGGVS